MLSLRVKLSPWLGSTIYTQWLAHSAHSIDDVALFRHTDPLSYSLTHFRFSSVSHSNRIAPASPSENGHQIAHLHFLGELLVHPSGLLGVVRSFVSYVPGLQRNAFLFDLLDVEVAKAVAFVADAWNCLDGGKPFRG